MKRWPSTDRKPNFAHAPRFVGQRFDDLRASLGGAVVERLDIVDTYIRHITVIAQVPGWHRVRAPAEHEVDRAQSAEGPIAGVRIGGLTTEHLAVPSGRPRQVVHREDRVRVEELHRRESLAVIRRGWDADHYQEWLTRTLVEQLVS